MILLQAVADQLHENFYEDRFHDAQLRERLQRATELVEQLWNIREWGPNPDFVPTPEQQRTMERLGLSEEEVAADPLIDYPPPLPPFVPQEE